MASKSSYDPEFHPIDMVERMSRGELNCRIQAAWGISKMTFGRWRKEFPEFDEAYQIGQPKWETAWALKGEKYMEEGNDKPFRYWIAVMNNKAGWSQTNRGEGTTNITNVQVNMLDQKNNTELLSYVQNKIEKFKDLGIINADFKVLDDHSRDEEGTAE